MDDLQYRRYQKMYEAYYRSYNQGPRQIMERKESSCHKEEVASWRERPASIEAVPSVSRR